MKHYVAFCFTTLLTANAAIAQQPDQEGPTPPEGSAVAPHWSGLPFMADEALARGYELPLPFGVGVILTGIDDREIDVTDVRLGIEGSADSVSDYAMLGSSSTVFNSNLRFDTWLLPFLNVYAIVGYVRNESDTDIHVTLPAPGQLPGSVEYDTTVKTSLDGVVGGLGTTLAGGYKSFFAVLDYNYVRSDMGFDDDFTAQIVSLRAGWQGKVRGRGVQVWLGAGDWDTAATATGHVGLDDGRRLIFEADQRPHTNWIYDLGANIMLNKHWQLFVDVGADFNGGHVAILGPTWRF